MVVNTDIIGGDWHVGEVVGRVVHSANRFIVSNCWYISCIIYLCQQ